MKEPIENPDIIEVFHEKLLETFHTYRKVKGGSTFIALDGIMFNDIIAKAKQATKETE